VDHLHHIEEIFQEALQRDPDQREAFVRDACGGDDELHREVSSLLVNHDEAADGETWAAAAAARLMAGQRSLEPGTAFGPYRIERFLAAGGMGEVYRARDTRLERIVAIKVLPAELASDPQFRERFQREARVISQLDHPHICTLYDVGEQSGGVLFLVMQCLEGETLEQRLKSGAVPLDHALRYATQMADALATAHHAGIVHRDLKPGNIMLTKSGVTLLDFGLAKAIGSVNAAAGVSMPSTTPPGLTAQGTILGTFQYMTPEQLEGHEADARTDIFAFGAVVYEMVAGKKAFSANSQASLIAAILKDDPPRLSTLQPLASPLLDHIVRRCLAKDPEERWQAASDVMRELKWIADAAPGLVSSDASPRTSVRRWWMISLAVIVLVAAVASLALIGRFLRPAPAASDLLMFAVAPPEGATFVAPGGPVGQPWLALSPDGRVLAFVALSADGRQQLWTRPLATTSAHPLPGTDGAQAPFWSPDSRSLAFFARGKLKVVDAAGGTPQIVTDAPGYFGSGTWSRDNTIVFASSPRNEGLRSVQLGVAQASHTLTRIDPGKGQRGHFSPQFLPDGRHFLFGVGGAAAGGGEAETWVGSLDGGAPRLLLRAESAAHYAEPGYLMFKRGPLVAQRIEQRDVRLVGDPVPLTAPEVGSSSVVPYLALSTSTSGTLAYGATRAGETRLVWQDRSGRLLGSVDVTGASAPSLSRDGRMLAVSRTLPQTGTDLWLYDVKRDTPTRLTFDSTSTRSGVWSPDGKEVVFAAARNGTLGQLYRKPTTGSGSDELLSKIDGSTPSDWSLDGRFILFHTNNNLDQGNVDQRNGFDLWVLSVADRQARPLVRTPFHEIQGAFSPDGRWLAYASDESGVFEVYVQAFPDSQAKQLVSRGGGAEPRWRADGRELFYVSPDRRMMAVPTTIGAAFEAGTPATLFEMNVRGLAFTSGARYDVTPDGQRFVVQELTGRDSPSALTVVVNWSALLPKER
jgi:eukaryotic-like serine/threonine-protein kinase